jgi:putative endonuclease
VIRIKGFADNLFGAPTTKQVGDDAESLALVHLQAKGLRLIQRHYRTPGRGGGEIDLVMWHGSTLVFVEVRARRCATHGEAAATVNHGKQRRIIHAARHYLRHCPQLPACRFDVVTVEPGPQGLQVQWFVAAFEAQ